MFTIAVAEFGVKIDKKERCSNFPYDTFIIVLKPYTSKMFLIFMFKDLTK